MNKHGSPERYPEAWYVRVARGYGVPPEMLEDAIQEMKIGIWQGRQIRHVLIDFLRKETKFRRSSRTFPARTISLNWDDQSLEDVLPGPQYDLDFVLDVEAALDSMPERARKMLLLKAVGLPIAMIAQTLGVSERITYNRLQRARASLRERVA